MSGAAASRGVLAGIGLLMLSCLFFATNDTGSKVAVLAGVPVMLGVWVRYVAQAVSASVAVLPRRGLAVFRTRSPGFQCLRGALLLAGSIFVFVSLRHIPVGEFTAIIMIAPLVVTLLGATVLGERVSPLRWLLVAGGFAGTLVIMRPGGAQFTWAMLLPLCQVACNVGFQLLTSRLARTEDPLTMHLYTSWIGALLATLALPFVWTSLASGWLWAMLVGMGVIASIGHFVLILAFQRAPASTLMPYVYVQIGFAMLAGWLVFGHMPDGWSVLGMALIAACGVAAAWLTVREHRARAVPPVRAER
ncbi:DMT family transporter [Ramlibacter rhizophilus]|uniref:DMT family transporter n=1 Tax=Ramlibacter rhizophilus TaxID=1781167 RepID=A0A4Z0BTK3_9BURK|nr:DMT family transporter [Ramlibacter rhizophilus]TFZ01345.1 DMT family transporter [Ramlibacter rhizophilus]